MDFRKLCQKLDVDAIRAKIPPLPALPAMPHLKLPKAIPKLKSRKIFRSSREDVHRNSPQKPMQPNSMMGSMHQLPLPPPPLAPPPLPPSGFVKHTPTRISTISSLMNEESGDGSTYRSAGTVDDDFPITSYYSTSVTTLRPISPLRVATFTADGRDVVVACPEHGDGQVKMSLSQRLYRSYKDLSDFRIKHIFTKKTVVRKDHIHVAHYVAHYEEDRLRESHEQDRRDCAIAENYTFRFKESRQRKDHSNSITPDDSPRSEPIIRRRGGRSVGDLSGDESGMEATPPPRKPGIASTRFAKVRNPPLRQSSSEHQSEREDEQIIPSEPNESTVWSIQKRSQQHEEAKAQSQGTRSKFSYKDRMRRFASNMSTDEKDESAEVARDNNKMLSKLKRLGRRSQSTETDINKQEKRKLPGTPPRSSDDEQVTASASPSHKAFNTIRHNFKRLQQSIKSRNQRNATDESEDESSAAPAQTSGGRSKVEKLTTRLRRFRSRDVSVEDLDVDDGAESKNKSPQSPIRQAISDKLETWKKSFKRRSNNPDDVQAATDGDDGETSPEKENVKTSSRQNRSDTLIKKLRYIRARKSVESKDEIDANTDTGDQATTEESRHKSKSTTAKFNEARQRTFKKVNETMQNIKFFHKSEERQRGTGTGSKSNNNDKKYHSEEEDWDEPSQEEETIVNVPPTITRRDFPHTHENQDSPEEDSIEEMAMATNSTFSIPNARAAWTSRPITSQSMESDIDPSELPRVLIHQDNSDSYESTLIIAVTRPVIASSSSASPIITEIKPEPPRRSLEQDWIPNASRDCRKQSIESIRSSSGSHKRKHSVDSSSNSDSDLDSWLPEHRLPIITSRRTSQTGLVSIDEKSEAWKVKPVDPAEIQSLYKTKSIDIFEKNILKGGMLSAFEDFDDELRNEPILKIRGERNVDSAERGESSEDTADDDNSSRITKISVARLIEEPIADPPVPETKRTSRLQYGNSRESLIANFDENEEIDSNNNEEEEEDEEDDDEEEDDRPPSAAPSPPPPPLPQRQPSIRAATKKPTNTPPPLPKTKPPRLPLSHGAKVQAIPPRIPERTASMARAPKPLVKTSSLRLVYSEQVKPADVGKVNKLISKFEPLDGSTAQRPRVIPRRIRQDDSEDYTDDEEDYATMVDRLKERYANIKIERDTTPTPTNTPKKYTPEIKRGGCSAKNLANMEPPLPIRIKRELIVPMVVTTTDEDNNIQILTQPVEMSSSQGPADQYPTDINSNNSRPNSEYGSPLEYPSSLRGSLETIPSLERPRDGNGQQRIRNVDRHNTERSRRSMTRDDDNYYSFDSDEENSYYSISSTGSNRYVVEL